MGAWSGTSRYEKGREVGTWQFWDSAGNIEER